MSSKKERIPHIMKGNIKTTTPSNLVFFDCETRNKSLDLSGDIQHHYLWFGHVRSVLFQSGRNKRETSSFFTTIPEFWEILESRLIDKKPLYVFAHNLGFDLTIVDFWNQAEKLGIDIISAVLESPPMFLECIWRGSRILFIDTLNYWRASLAEIGKSFGVDKLEMPAEKQLTNKWREYCARDTEVLATAVCSLMTYIKGNNLGKFALTQASQAMQAFKTRFMSHPIYIHDNNAALDLERNSYKGGLVHCFYIGKVKAKEIYHVDVNSLYPSVMLSDFPTKLLGVKKNPTVSETKKLLTNHAVVAQCLINSERVPYPHHLNNRLIEATGIFTTTLCGPELEKALNQKHVVRVDRLAYYKTAPIFKDYINFFWEERLRYKKIGDKVNDTFSKILMNSLYGKFGQRGYEWVELNCDNIRLLYELYGMSVPKAYTREGFQPPILWEQRQWFPLGLDFGLPVRSVSGLIQMKLPNGEHYESSPIVSATVTALGRDRLRRLVSLCGPRQVFYVDTDSLFTTAEGYEKLIKAKEVDDKALGKLKLVAIHKNMTIYGAKDYIVEEEEVIKGIRKNAEKIDDNTYRQVQFEGVRSVLKRGGDPYIQIKTIIKTLSRKYEKGIVGKDGWVKYLKLGD